MSMARIMGRIVILPFPPSRPSKGQFVAETRAATRASAKSFQDFAQRFARIKANIETVIEGKADVVHLALVALVAEGHVLIEDVPGVGKTMLAKALAGSIGCT